MKLGRRCKCEKILQRLQPNCIEFLDSFAGIYDVYEVLNLMCTTSFEMQMHVDFLKFDEEKERQ